MCQYLGSTGDISMIYHQLTEFYSQPHRAYHTLAHVQDCLKQLDDAREMAERSNEVEAALWFHDAIYEPQARDNEKRSAAWARQALIEIGVGSEVAERVAVMVLLTRHDQEPDTQDGALLLDIDLSILGQPWEVFAMYERNIRIEYNWVLEEHYQTARSSILEGFLQRPTIYRTRFFQMQLEAQAKANLKRSIIALGTKGFLSHDRPS
jgi:predicted metal-dependent HD superfamily phosphohydrolase